jgi:hypothetical protein
MAKRGSEPFLGLEGPCSGFSGRDGSRADHLSSKEGLVCMDGSLCLSGILVGIGNMTGLWLAIAAEKVVP